MLGSFPALNKFSTREVGGGRRRMRNSKPTFAMFEFSQQYMRACLKNQSGDPGLVARALKDKSSSLSTSKKRKKTGLAGAKSRHWGGGGRKTSSGHPQQHSWKPACAAVRPGLKIKTQRDWDGKVQARLRIRMPCGSCGCGLKYLGHSRAVGGPCREEAAGRTCQTRKVQE